MDLFFADRHFKPLFAREAMYSTKRQTFKCVFPLQTPRAFRFILVFYLTFGVVHFG